MKKKKKQVAKVFAKTDDGTLIRMHFDKDDDDFKITGYSGYIYVIRKKNDETVAIIPREHLVYITRSCR